MSAHHGRDELHRWVDAMSDSEAAAIRAHLGHGAPQRRLSREESIALADQIWGPPTEEGRAAVLELLGLDDEQQRAS